VSRPHFCVWPMMIPVEPVQEYIVQGAETCPVCSDRADSLTRPVVQFGWLRFPRLRRQKGLATGIIGLW
jgi:hypothetical protein